MNKKFINAMDILKEVEHSNKNDKLLHKNAGENGLTFFGTLHCTGIFTS